MGIDALRFAPLIVYLVIGGQLSLIDFRTHRLPNRLVAMCTLLMLALQVAYCLWIGSGTDLSRAGLTAGKIFAAYVVLYLFSRGQLGMGDVKFAVPVGLLVGWYNPDGWLISLLLTFLLAGVVGVIGLLTGKLDRKSNIPFGPYMYVGSIITVLMGM
ncbi:MAG: A24 family peptidase [Actinomycetes bacterium]|jgi:leader peptidase (prepilin peptidase) / N-methyltransferase